MDGDGNYGERYGDFGDGGVDRYWEVLVGRIPYYGSISDLDNILQKTINYENRVCGDSPEWQKKVLLPMVRLDDTTLCYYLGEKIKDNILVPQSHPYHRVYEQDYGLVPPPETIPYYTKG